MAKILADWTKLYFEDGSYIHVNPLVGIIKEEEVSNKELPRGLYSFDPFNSSLLYLEELEWYEVDNEYTLHFIGYTTDEFIRENITRRLNNL